MTNRCYFSLAVTIYLPEGRNKKYTVVQSFKGNFSSSWWESYEGVVVSCGLDSVYIFQSYNYSHSISDTCSLSLDRFGVVILNLHFDRKPRPLLFYLILFLYVCQCIWHICVLLAYMYMCGCVLRRQRRTLGVVVYQFIIFCLRQISHSA